MDCRGGIDKSGSSVIFQRLRVPSLQFYQFAAHHFKGRLDSIPRNFLARPPSSPPPPSSVSKKMSGCTCIMCLSDVWCVCQYIRISYDIRITRYIDILQYDITTWYTFARIPREKESHSLGSAPPPRSPHSTYVSVIYVFYLVVPSEWSAQAQAQASSCVLILRQHRTKSQHILSPPPFIRTPRRGDKGNPKTPALRCHITSHPAYYSVLQRITAVALPHPLRSELRRLE